MPNTEITPLNTILSWYETGDYPTQAQFQASWSSFWHKNEKLPISAVYNLEESLQKKLDKSIFDSQLTQLAKIDASNITDVYKQSWRTALGVGDLPENIATIDFEDLEGNTFKKAQIRDMYMAIADYVLNGKIRADKIEALGLTELIEVTETSLNAFITNSGNYEYQKNDFIAIPINGNYSLYIFKGGSKTVAGNYLPTGLTNITISMVEGLQSALNNKMDKPTGNGSFLVQQTGSVTSYTKIEPASYYLVLFNGTTFIESNAYFTNGKIGIGTTAPTEMLHLNNGRIRAKGMVFDVNTETIPNQITFDGTKFWGTSTAGVKRPFMYQDFAAFKELWSSLTEAQSNEIKTIANGGWSTGTMSVAIVSPPIVDRTNRPFWINLKGANLNLNPASFKVELCTGSSSSAVTATVVTEIPASQVQLYTSGIDLRFYFNFQNIPIGTYKIRLWNGVAYYLTSFTISVVDEINRVDLNNIIWSKKIYNNATSAVITESGASVNYNSDANVKAMADDSSFIAGRKTNELIGADEDFYMTVEITGKTAQQTNANGSMTHFIGLVNSGTNVDLLNQTVVNVRVVNSYWYPMAKFYADNSTTQIPTNDSTFGITAIFMRNGSSWTVIVTSNNVTQAFTKTGYTGAVSFGMFNQNTVGNTGVSANIVELYKF